MNRKHQFMQAVRLLAPNDSFILQAAQHIHEEALPYRPGGVALEFVAVMERLRASGTWTASTRLPAKELARKCMSRVGAGQHQAPELEEQSRDALPLKHAIHVKSAEYWLKLGQPVQALLELEQLPEQAKKHPWALKVTVSAIGAARELNEITVQA